MNLMGTAVTTVPTTNEESQSMFSSSIDFGRKLVRIKVL